MNEKEIIFETTKLDCGCEYVLNDYEQMKLIFCNEHIYEKYSVGDFTFIKNIFVSSSHNYNMKLLSLIFKRCFS